MSIFFQGCGRNLEQLEEKPTQAEEEEDVLPVQLSKTGLGFLSCKTGPPVIPKRLHTGAGAGVCPWEASITCHPPPGTDSTHTERRDGTEAMTQTPARTAGTEGSSHGNSH